jgi:hypothetical protein
MSLQSLNKDELILIIQNLEKNVRDEYIEMKKELSELRWRYQYCHCEHTIKKCSIQGCKAKAISGRSLHPTYKYCNEIYLCEHCSIAKSSPPRRWGGKWEKEVWYCDQHINNHVSCNSNSKCSYRIDNVKTTPTSDRDSDSDN